MKVQNMQATIDRYLCFECHGDLRTATFTALPSHPGEVVCKSDHKHNGILLALDVRRERFANAVKTLQAQREGENTALKYVRPKIRKAFLRKRDEERQRDRTALFGNPRDALPTGSIGVIRCKTAMK